MTLEEWAGAPHLGLTLLFTDIVESTSIGIRLGDNRWIEDLFKHEELRAGWRSQAKTRFEGFGIRRRFALPDRPVQT